MGRLKESNDSKRRRGQRLHTTDSKGRDYGLKLSTMQSRTLPSHWNGHYREGFERLKGGLTEKGVFDSVYEDELISYVELMVVRDRCIGVMNACDKDIIEPKREWNRYKKKYTDILKSGRSFAMAEERNELNVILRSLERIIDYTRVARVKAEESMIKATKEMTTLGTKFGLTSLSASQLMSASPDKTVDASPMAMLSDIYRFEYEQQKQ